MERMRDEKVAENRYSEIGGKKEARKNENLMGELR